MLEPRLLLTTFVVPDTIDYSGVTDVTAAIQSYLDSVPDGTQQSPNTIVFHQDGNYHIEGTLTLANRTGLIINGNNALFNADRQLIFDNADDDTFGSASWNAHWTWEGLATTRVITSGTGQITPTTPPVDWTYGLATINDAKNTDADLTCTFKADSTQAKFGLFGRRADIDNDTYYYANIEVGQSQVKIMKVVDGVETQIAVATGATVSANTNYTMQFQCLKDVGHTDLRAKYFATGGADPGWLIDTTDNDARLASIDSVAHTGMWFAFKGSGSTYVDNFYVNGDANVYTRSQWSIGLGSSYITLQNTRIDGAYPEGTPYSSTREAQHGVVVGDPTTHDIVIDGIDARHAYGDGFYAGSGAHDITVQNSHLQYSGRQGLSVCNNYNVVISNNFIGDAQRSLFDIEPYAADWYVDHLIIIGNTTGVATNAWLSMHQVGSVFVANNTVNGAQGLDWIQDTGTLACAYRGPITVVNNSFNNGTSSNTISSSNIPGEVFLGNQATYSSSVNITPISLTNGEGATIGNNNFVNAAQSTYYIDSTDKDALAWDNQNVASGWTSSTTLTTLTNGYYFSTPYSGQGVTNGTLVGIVRKFSGSDTITNANLSITGNLAVVLLDANGDMVSGYVTGGTGTYKNAVLPSLAVAPTVLTQPASQTVVSGQSTTFSVVVDGSAPLAYQWKKNGAVLSDATLSSYTFTAASGDNGAQYTCVVTNKYGTTTSTAATLTVAASASPTITAQPAAASVATGYAATFTVGASGPGPLSYQWQKNGVNITGATAATYVTPVTVLGDNGATFGCVVTNATGPTTSNAAALTVANVSPAETWTGNNGDSWPSQWQVTKPTGVTVNIQSNAGNISYGTGAGVAVCTLDPAGSSFDAIVDSVQQVSILAHTNTTTLYGSLMARCADSDPTNFYEARMENANGVGNVLRIYRSGAQLATTVAGTWAYDTWYKVKFSVQSLNATTTELKAKIWLATDIEPPTWTLTVDDSGSPLQGVPGRVGIRSYVGSSTTRYWRFDDYTLTPTASGTGPSGATNLAAAMLSGSHTRLTWTDNSGSEDGFVVQRSTDGTNFSDVAYLARNTTAYTDTGLTADTRYFYRIRTYNAAGFGSDSASVRATSIDTAPGSISETWTGANGDAWAEKWTFEGNTSQVANKDIQSNAGRLLCNGSASGGVIAYLNTYQAEGVDQTVKFKVDANGGGVGFVARRTDADSDSYYYVSATAGSDQLLFYKVVDGTSTQLASMKASLVTAGTDYKLRFLCQTNGSATDLKAKLWLASDSEPGSWTAAITDAEPLLQGVSGRFGLRYELSNSHTMTTDDYSASFAPTSSSVSGLTATTASATQVNLAWTDNSSSETGYRIQRSPDGRTGWTTVTTTAAGATSYNDTGLMPSTRYYYRVAAVNTGGADAWPMTANAVTSDISGDVRESFTLDEYSAWPTKWTLEGATASATNIDVFGGCGRVVAASVASGNIYASVNTSNAQDTNQVATFACSSNGGGFGLMSRRADSAATTYYYCVATSSSSTMYLYKMVNGVSTEITHATITAPTPLLQYKVRMLTQQNGAATDLKVKIWLASSAEPGTWNITATGNTEPTLQNVSGRSGVVVKLFNMRVVTTDNYICSSGNFLSAPTAPTGLAATAASPSQINLSWTDASNNESSFVVERSPDGSTGWAQVAAVTPGTTSYSDTALAASTTYYYRVKASNGIGDSSYTSNASATTLIAIPAAPTGLSATAASPVQINLAWTDNASNESGFKVERSADGGSTWNEISPYLAANTTSFSDTNLSPATTYHYRVRSYNTSGNSAYSNIVNATTLNAITETWTGSNGAAWPSQWTKQVVSGNLNTSIQSSQGQIDASGTTGTVLMYVNSLNATDTEQLVWFNVNNNATRPGFVSRRADGDSDTYYGVETSTASTYAYIYKMVDGTKTNLAAVPLVTANTNYWMRFRAQTNGSSTDLKFKLWQASGSEPSSWNTEISDSTARLQGISGRFGLYGCITIAGSRKILYDNYTGSVMSAVGFMMMRGAATSGSSQAQAQTSSLDAQASQATAPAVSLDVQSSQAAPAAEAGMPLYTPAAATVKGNKLSATSDKTLFDDQDWFDALAVVTPLKL